MDLLGKTLKEGKFKKEGRIQDLLILLSKSLFVADLNNKEHQKILKELGDVLAEGHPKQAWYFKLLTLLGIAIKYGKFLEDDRQETLKIVGKIVETESFEPDEAAEILIAMLVHNLRPNLDHYKRLGLDPVKFEKEFLEKIEPRSQTKIQKKCKKCKLCKKHKK
ncbi:hypothetical protein NBO_65g0017 [Nosema bombycis CQ1]|uniref:Uncharacterized protein n=1 Tax=Nosema bombycis (strain CQ1 / CVCC 102059) TaxID=578461 RepID=R0MLA8_NOSB1|nr:hypothetical protein NBO_65g0017 [Nosema bombycis CQ1]|eukprot:EOB13613.1 hypothetical protein NBO_65g0017 [Nosema bombycis CQ1]